MKKITDKEIETYQEKCYPVDPKITPFYPPYRTIHTGWFSECETRDSKLRGLAWERYIKLNKIEHENSNS